MASPKLPNYLKANRKRLALSQDDVAFLLGVESGAKVCRYERFVRGPGLETALALEAIFEKPVSELFAGMYHKVEKVVAARAVALNRKADVCDTTGYATRRRQALATIVAKRAKRTNQ